MNELREISLLKLLEQERDLVSKVNSYRENIIYFLQVNKSQNLQSKKEAALRFAKEYEKKAQSAAEDLVLVRSELRKYLILIMKQESEV